MTLAEQSHTPDQEARRTTELRTALLRLLQLVVGDIIRQVSCIEVNPGTPPSSTKMVQHNKNNPRAGRFGAPPVSNCFLVIKIRWQLSVRAACRHRAR